MSATDGLVVDDLHRSFDDVQALAGVSFTVEPGTLHGFVGANGAGKTTTMRIIVGIDRADRGEVRIDGSPPSGAVRQRIGYIPEERGLYPDMPVREQVVLFAGLRGVDGDRAERRTDELIERLGLADRADGPASELSQGNQQRVQLAVALVHEPDLLVLDEPFAGLDPVAADVMAELLVEQTERGVPVLFSSHQLERVEKLCDHVTIIADGRLVADGSIPQLRAARTDRRVRVRVDGAQLDWAEQPGVTATAEHDGEVVLTLAEDADEQQLLDVARDAGQLRAYTPVEPSLAELYREATS